MPVHKRLEGRAVPGQDLVDQAKVVVKSRLARLSAWSHSPNTWDRRFAQKDSRKAAARPDSELGGLPTVGTPLPQLSSRDDLESPNLL